MTVRGEEGGSLERAVETRDLSPKVRTGPILIPGGAVMLGLVTEASPRGTGGEVSMEGGVAVCEASGPVVTRFSIPVARALSELFPVLTPFTPCPVLLGALPVEMCEEEEEEEEGEGEGDGEGGFGWGCVS